MAFYVHITHLISPIGPYLVYLLERFVFVGFVVVACDMCSIGFVFSLPHFNDCHLARLNPVLMETIYSPFISDIFDDTSVEPTIRRKGENNS